MEALRGHRDRVCASRSASRRQAASSHNGGAGHLRIGYRREARSRNDAGHTFRFGGDRHGFPVLRRLRLPPSQAALPALLIGLAVVGRTIALIVPAVTGQVPALVASLERATGRADRVAHPVSVGQDRLSSGGLSGSCPTRIRSRRQAA